MTHVVSREELGSSFSFFTLILQSTDFSETPSPDSDSVNSVEGHSEPSWFKDIKFDDSDTEQIAEEGDDNLTSEFPSVL